MDNAHDHKHYYVIHAVSKCNSCMVMQKDKSGAEYAQTRSKRLTPTAKLKCHKASSRSTENGTAPP